MLERVDSRIRRRFRAFLKVCAEPERLPEDEIRRAVVGSGQRIVAWAVTYRDSGESYEARAELQWYGRAGDYAQVPEFLRDLAMRAGAREVEWTPQASAL